MAEGLSLSLELIYLLNWLLKKEKGQIKKIIQKVVSSGLFDEPEEMNNYELDPENLAEMQETILDFLIFLEDTLLECLDEKDQKSVSKDRLKPTLQKLNPESLDVRTIWLSMQQTKAKLSKKEDTKTTLQTKNDSSAKTPNNQKAKKILFEQLLKHWNPNQNEPLN